MQQDAISAFRKNLNDLEEIVMQAKRVPLSNMCMVDRERILGLANAITTDLPTVFAECEGVVQNQITIISEANERAEQTKQNATMRANQYVTDAKNQAQQMTAQAQNALAVHHAHIAQRHAFGLHHNFLKVIEILPESGNGILLHGSFSSKYGHRCKARRTSSTMDAGTNGAISPPNRPISRTALELR